jgi:hypothetical protein
MTSSPDEGPSWSDIAAWYDQLLEAGSGPHQLALAAVHRTLRPGGWFVFVIGHPCFLAPDATPVTRPDGSQAVQVSGYFDERFWRSTNPNGVRRAGNHHRTLSTYLNALTQAGFLIDQVDEPRANALLEQQQPLYTEAPIFFSAQVRVR